MRQALVRFNWLAALLALLVGAASPSQAQEWTRFRGPNGQGISAATTIPLTYTAETANWRISLPGVGHSSPVVWGDRVFLTSADEGSGKQHLLCIRTTDGKILWDQTWAFPPYHRHEFNSFASSTPAVDADLVYASRFTGDTIFLDALTHDGKAAWTRELGKYQSQHGGATSPIVVGDLVILRGESDAMGPGSFIVALDRKTGEVRWRRPREEQTVCYSTPILYEPKGGPAQLIVASNGNGFTSLNPKTGDVNWEVAGLFQQRCVCGPVLVNGLLFATAGEAGSRRQAVAIQPGTTSPKTDPKVAYQVTKQVPYVPTPIVVGDRLYLWGDGGIVSCLKADSGEVVWSERVGVSFFGSPVCVGGKIYAVGTHGELVVLQPGDEYKLLARSELGENSNATPAVSGGVMYLRTESHLISLGGAKKVAGAR